MSKRTKRMALVGGILLAGFMVFMSAGGFAANPQAISVSANVPATLQMTMAPLTVDFGGGALAPGSVYTGTTVATVSSNKGWSMGVSKDQDLSATIGGTLYTIPSANLTYGVAGAGGVQNPQAAGTPFVVAPGSNVC